VMEVGLVMSLERGKLESALPVMGGNDDDGNEGNGDGCCCCCCLYTVMNSVQWQ